MSRARKSRVRRRAAGERKACRRGGRAPEGRATHCHAWVVRGLVVIAQPTRFQTRQAACNAAIQAELEADAFAVDRTRATVHG